jgi:hypothetical protein
MYILFTVFPQLMHAFKRPGDFAAPELASAPRFIAWTFGVITQLLQGALLACRSPNSIHAAFVYITRRESIFVPRRLETAFTFWMT